MREGDDSASKIRYDGIICKPALHFMHTAAGCNISLGTFRLCKFSYPTVRISTLLTTVVARLYKKQHLELVKLLLAWGTSDLLAAVDIASLAGQV